MNFLWDIYRELNPDLVKVGLKTKSDFEKHYKENGAREKRAFHLYHKYPDFNPLQYKLNNIDLNYMNVSELERHWLFYGRNENRSYQFKSLTTDEPNHSIKPVKRRRKKTEPIKESNAESSIKSKDCDTVKTFNYYVNADCQEIIEIIKPPNEYIRPNQKKNEKQKIEKCTEPTIENYKQPVVEAVKEKPKEAVLEVVKHTPRRKVVEAVKEKPKEAVLEVVKETPKEAVLEAVKEKPKEAVLEAVKEKPKEAVLEAVKEKPKEAVLEAVKEKPKEAVLEVVKEKPKEAVLEVVKHTPTQKVVDAVKEKSKEAVLEVVKEKSKEAVLDAVKHTPRRKVLEAVKHTPKEAVVEAVKDTPKEAVVEAVKDTPKEAVEAVKHTPRQKVVEAVKEKPKEAVVEAVKEKSKEAVAEVKIPNKEISKTVISEFNNMGLYNIYISNDLGHLDRICQLYNMMKSTDSSVPLILFGLYNRNDYQVLNHHKSALYIMWGGTDEMMLSPNTVQILINSSHIHHIAISKDIHNRLLTRGFERVHYINLDLTNYTVFKPIDKKGNTIFIYNGYNKGQEDKYGKIIYDQVINRLPDYEYIFSNELGGIPNDKMYDIYKTCFIGLRLTNHDGNANMVGELKAMGIPVIHNISEYGLKWSSVDDVVRIIKEHRSIGTNLDFYNNSIVLENLEIIKENIDIFKDCIQKYKNILFISSDYPGYGGAATNCYRLQEFFGKEHQVYSIYYNFIGDPNRKIETNSEYCIIDEDKVDVILRTMRFQPDLIILKSFVNTVNLKSLVNCPIYYLIPGMFLNTLNKYYNDIKNRNEMDSFINKSVLKQIMNSDKSFCNSNHTRLLLKKYYNINTGLFYSSFVNEYDNLSNNSKLTIQDEGEFKKRQYKYGIICSNFNRPIKNVSESILKLKDKRDVVLIGKESKQFTSYGFTCIESIPFSEMSEYYKKIKYIVQDSFYESCSNVKVEALFNGCKVINSNSDIIIKDIVREETNLLDKNDIYVLDVYREERYENLCKTIDYFDKLGIRLYYLLLSKKTQLLNKYNHRIRIQDNTKTYQIDNIVNKLLSSNLEQIFYSNELETSMSELIHIFRNYTVLSDNIFQSIITKQIKIFINFRCSNVPYGGGNQFIMNLVECLSKLSNIKITYDLEQGIDIYFIVDIRKGPFKKYTFDEIYNHKQRNGGFIIYRINDCSITRLNCKLESIILENVKKIDHFVFNSTFIHDYYTDKYDEFKKGSLSIIYNTSNSNFFYPKGCSSETYPKPLTSISLRSPLMADLSKKLKIVTHHWSDNINKGYDIYYQLHQYCKGRDDMELVILGRKFADGFAEPPPVCGPYKGKELGDMLRECDIYISASKYDSCPMHILEGISCGLPIVYLEHSGGVKDICEMADDVIGEGFYTLEECIQKINMIKSNYEMYYKNIVKNIDLYNSNQCYSKYIKLFLQSK